MSKKGHVVSRESLHHFCCSVCGKWWTIGDAPETQKEWYCPWCGNKQKTK